VAEVRGYLAALQLADEFPNIDFALLPTSELTETVLTPFNLEALNLDMNWWLAKWYTEPQIRFIIRTALKELDSSPDATKLAKAGVTVEEYQFMEAADYAVEYAEKLLIDVEAIRNPGVAVPLGVPAVGTTYTTPFVDFVGSDLEIAGIDIIFVLRYGFTY